jgi:hypothetical protein
VPALVLIDRPDGRSYRNPALEAEAKRRIVRIRPSAMTHPSKKSANGEAMSFVNAALVRANLLLRPRPRRLPCAYEAHPRSA